MKRELKEKEWAALAVLKSASADVLEAAIVAKELISANGGRVRRARQCIARGIEAMRLQEKTVSFEKAAEVALAARRERRPRTQSDFRYFTQRFKKCTKTRKSYRLRTHFTQKSELLHHYEITFTNGRFGLNSLHDDRCSNGKL